MSKFNIYMKLVNIFKKYKFNIMIAFLLIYISYSYYKSIEGYSNVKHPMKKSPITQYLQRFRKKQNNNQINNYRSVILSQREQLLKKRQKTWGKVIKNGTAQNNTQNPRERTKGLRWRGEKNKKRNGLGGNERGGFAQRGGRRLS